MNEPTRRYSVEIAGMKLSVGVTEEQIDIEGVEESPVIDERGSLRTFSGRTSDGLELPIYVEQGEEPHTYTVFLRGEVFAVRVRTEHDERLAALRRTSATAATSAHTVVAPMPGMLKQVLVEEGEVVPKGASLCILEAMKMENEIKSPARLRVQRIFTRAGSAVEKGTRLVELGPAEETASE